MRARLITELFETLLVINVACEFFLTYRPVRPVRIRCWDGRGEAVA
jgi:hypothetical protein